MKVIFHVSALCLNSSLKPPHSRCHTGALIESLLFRGHFGPH